MKKAILGVVLATTGVTGAIGLLHTKIGRPLLVAIGGCPIKATPEGADRARVASMAKMRGETKATARPAAGFVLDVTTPDEVHAWAKKNDLSCKDTREGMLVTCTDVPARALVDRPDRGEGVSEVALAFRPRDKTLVNVTVTSMGMKADVAASEMTRTKSVLDKQLGPPSTAAGDISAAHLAKGGYATATVSYNHADFVAEVTATGFGPRGVMLREHYVSAVD